MRSPKHSSPPRRRRRRKRAAPGSRPGTLAIDADAPAPRIRAITYGPEEVRDHAPESAAEAAGLLGEGHVTWVDVTGLGDEATLRDLAKRFGLHPLALEDVVNTSQRAKVEQYAELLYVVVHMAETHDDYIDTEQISIFVGADFVLTFQEREGDCFDPIRRRMEQVGARLRKRGPDYLCYALVDAVVDHYFPLLEHLGERIETLEEEIFTRPGPHTVQKIHQVKRDLLRVRKAIWPKREALSSLFRDPHPLIKNETDVFFRDCYDHTIQLIDMVETYRELASSLMDMYLTTVSNRMNEIMKVLTIIATIFIPLGFIAGVYGMNFDASTSKANMPELSWRYGYLFCLGLMAAVATVMLVYFRRKGWLGGGGSDPSSA